jgi:CRP-like cAMP-binding protein
MQMTFLPDQTIAHRLLVQVGVGRATTSYADDQKIYNQGESADFVYFIQEGCVKRTVTS